MQNHLSEVAYKILRNPSLNSLNDDSEKVLLQKEIEEINEREIVCAQYEGIFIEVFLCFKPIEAMFSVSL